MSESSTTTAFDADAFATEPPELRIGGRVYVGRLLSITEWFAFKDRLTAQAAAEKAEGETKRPATMEAARQLMLEFLRAMFPPLTQRDWRRSGGLRRVIIDPIDVFESRGLRDVQTTFVRFFIHQRHAMGFAAPLMTSEPTEPAATNGTDSPPRTTRAPSGDAPLSASEPAS
jgi:hypothetical protein